jgi:hypothetical protein
MSDLPVHLSKQCRLVRKNPFQSQGRDGAGTQDGAVLVLELALVPRSLPQVVGRTVEVILAEWGEY